MNRLEQMNDDIDVEKKWASFLMPEKWCHPVQLFLKIQKT
jgi:hypothetical protein